ncbi:MAG: polysaccharide biosynthesis tyrosine autokinase [Acidimicrobiales bacterium]
MTKGSVVPMTEYADVLKRWSRLIVAFVVVGAAIGLALIVARGGDYVTSAVVQIRPAVAANDDPSVDPNRQISPDTEVAIARSQRVAERALALRRAAVQLGVDDLSSPDVALAATTVTVDPDEARRALDRLAVTIVDDTQILVFEAAGDEAGPTRDLAQSSALSYLEFRRQEAATGNAEARLRLEAREAELVAQLGEFATTLGAAGDDPVTVQVLAYADIAKREELGAIGAKYANLEALTVDPGVILTDAALPFARGGLPLYAGPVTGALLGLVAALTAAFLLDRADDRLRSSRTELVALGVPMLGTAPVARTRRRSGTGAGTVSGADDDAYRRLHGSLAFTLDSGNKSMVLVAGVTRHEGASAVAANMAVAAARTGRRILVVGADLRNGGLLAQLAVAPTTGVSDVIVDGASLAEAIAGVPGVDNLAVLGPGNRLDRPADVLRSESFARLMTAVRADFELVVVQAPPVLAVADAVDIAALCDGAVLVAEAETESRQAVADAVAQLRSIGSDIVGVVVAESR